MPERTQNRAGLLQAANAWLAAKAFVEGDDFSGSKFESNFRDEVIRKPHSAFSRSFQCPACQRQRLDGYTSRLEHPLNGIQDSCSLPSATEHPGQLRKNKERHKYAFL